MDAIVAAPVEVTRHRRAWPGHRRERPCTSGSTTTSTAPSSRSCGPPAWNFEGPESSDLPQTLLGQAVVVTGTLDNFSREEAEAAIKDPGGKSRAA